MDPLLGTSAEGPVPRVSAGPLSELGITAAPSSVPGSIVLLVPGNPSWSLELDTVALRMAIWSSAEANSAGLERVTATSWLACL